MAPRSEKSLKHKNNDKPKIDKASKKISKPKSGDVVKKSESLAMQLEDEVPDFPRGGEFKVKRSRDDYDKFGDDDDSKKVWKTKKKGKKVFKKSDEAESDWGLLSGAGITGKLPRYVNRVTLKNITPGMKLWGVVAEVNNKDLVVSLPGGLRGIVNASDALDPIFDDKTEVGESFLSSVFCVGKLVSCIVLRLDDDKKEKGHRKVWLSLRLSLLHKNFNLDVVQEGMVLAAYVKSIEDHGFILHFGLPSFTGFLPKEGWNGEVRIGQHVQGLVKSIDKVRKVIYLSSDSDTMSKSVTKDLKGMSIDLLVPGMMVNARVKSVLENGVLLSFLTYFTGTVDQFHLQNLYPATNWKDKYIESQKVVCRILFIDPSSRAVGLTLNPHLVQNRAPPSYVKIGDIYDNSKVVRVDKGSGLLLEVPSIPESTPAFVSISDIAEEEIQKLEKKYKEGNHVRVRILGLRHLEGLATGVLKASALEEAVFTHSDVKPGMVVKAKILSVDSFGAIVQIPGGVKALCPLRHMSELEIAKPGKKFKVGAELVFRVLGCKSKRVTVTHKKTLVKSKLEIISSFVDVTDGLITHGWITKIEDHGCFVRFYNGVQGFAPRSELGLEPGGDPGAVYNVGQVVKCRVVSSIPASKRINLSFIIKPTRVSEDEMVTLGSIVSGIVDRVTSNAVVVYIKSSGFSRGTISMEHLADHHGQATLMKSVLKPGYNFDKLLVLDFKGNNMILSAKSSLVKYAQQIPADISQMHPNSVVQGFICNLIETGCFVRFLGQLTGFSPRNKAADDQKTNILEAYYIGQSVRCNVSNINGETGRVTVSLKQTSCSSADASFIQDYFHMDEKIAKLQYTNPNASDLKWDERFNIGTVAEGRVEDVKDVGIVVCFEKYNDVFGFITNYQLGGTVVEKGSAVEAFVLDVAKAERLVDLTLKPEFINISKERSSISHTKKKKRQREALRDLVLHQTVTAVVEIVKESYLVVSIPENNYTIGYVQLSDYNTQRFPRKQFLNGQSVVATVTALPSPETSGRLLLLLNEVGASSSKRTKKSSYKVGSLVEAEITEIKAFKMKLKFGFGLHGRVHITEVHDANLPENPFSGYKIGQTVTARIVSKPNENDSSRNGSRWELTVCKIRFVFWNVRGVGGYKAFTIKTLLSETEAVLFGLVETFHSKDTDFLKLLDDLQIKYVEVPGVRKEGNPNRGRPSGGLLLGWSDKYFELTGHETNDRWIYMEGKLLGQFVSFMLVYGQQTEKERKKLYEDIKKKLKSSSSHPLMLCGDFNEVLEEKERWGCQSVSNGMKDFRACVEMMHEIDLANNLSFTHYYEKRGADKHGTDKHGASRLDRVFVEAAWNKLFGEIKMLALDRITSDHRPLLIGFDSDNLNVEMCPVVFSNLRSKMRMIQDAEKRMANDEKIDPNLMNKLRTSVRNWNIYILKNIEDVLADIDFETADATDENLIVLCRSLDVFKFEYRALKQKIEDLERLVIKWLDMEVKQLLIVGIILEEILTEWKRTPKWQVKLNPTEKNLLENVDRLITEVDKLDICHEMTDQEAVESIDKKIKFLRWKLEEFDKSFDCKAATDSERASRSESRKQLKDWCELRYDKLLLICFDNFQPI